MNCVAAAGDDDDINIVWLLFFVVVVGKSEQNYAWMANIIEKLRAFFLLHRNKNPWPMENV